MHCTAIPVEIGALPLPREMLAQSLDAQASTLLCPPPLGSPLSISFQALHSAPGRTGTPLVASACSCHCEQPAAASLPVCGVLKVRLYVQASPWCPMRCRKSWHLAAPSATPCNPQPPCGACMYRSGCPPCQCSGKPRATALYCKECSAGLASDMHDIFLATP